MIVAYYISGIFLEMSVVRPMVLIFLDIFPVLIAAVSLPIHLRTIVIFSFVQASVSRVEVDFPESEGGSAPARVIALACWRVLTSLRFIVG